MQMQDVPGGIHGIFVGVAVAFISVASWFSISLDTWVFVAAVALAYACALFIHRHVRSRRSSAGPREKPLLILDCNGVICYREWKPETDPRIRRFSHLDDQATLLFQSLTWTRPQWQEFRDDAFKHFHVAVWSSCKRHNLDAIVQHLFGDRRRDELLFTWDQSECVEYGKSTKPGKETFPAFTKPLAKVWKRYPQFSKDNTIILDDSLEKMCVNPDGTYIVVPSWTPDNTGDVTLRRVLGQLKDGFGLRT